MGWSDEKIAAFSEGFFAFLNVARINSKEKGQIVLGQHLYRAQRRFFDFVFDGLQHGVHDFKHLKSRQLGVSTSARALTVFWAGIHDGLRGYMVFDTEAHKEEARFELLEMLSGLPKEFSFPRVRRQNRYLIELENDTRINLAAAGARVSKTSGALGRSSGINFVFASELCSWGDPEGIEAFRAALAQDFPNRLYIWESPLALDTPVPSPDGWKTIGSIAEGDTVYDDRGQPSRVLGLSPIFINRKCYKLNFSNGDSVVADGSHKWRVMVRRWPTNPQWKEKIVTTEEIDIKNHRIEMPKSLQATDIELPIDPYLLGVWLGDGRTDNTVITAGDEDIGELRHGLIERGCNLAPTTKNNWRVGTFTVYDQRAIFKKLGLLGNKHIPRIYLRASENQRRELLAGLMDTDGHISKQNFRCEYCSISPRLIDDVAELLSSLGIKFSKSICSAEGKLRTFPSGLTYACAESYRLRFCEDPDLKVFNLSRKKNIQHSKRGERGYNYRKAKYLKIVSIEEVPSTPVRCLTVDAPSHLFLVGKTMIPTHNTAKGFGNIWHNMWEEAVADPDHQATLFTGWWGKDNQIIKKDDPEFRRYGDQAPSDEELKKIAIVKRDYGWDISVEQLAWVRRAMNPAAKADGDAPIEFEGSASRIQEQPWCVIENTRVGTNRGIVPIVEATISDWTSRGKIINAGCTGQTRIWRARTKLGYELFGTANHPLITVDGEEIDLSESTGAKIRLQPPMTATTEGEFECSWREPPAICFVRITEQVARFVGLFMGDGSASNNKNHGTTEVSIACTAKDDDVVQECVKLFTDIFEVAPQVKIVGGCATVRATKKSVFDAIKKLGLLCNDTSRTHRRVHVPDFIWRSKKSIIREFLRGLFEADGFNAYETNRVALFSKYPDFIQDIQLLLLAFGITSRIVSMRKRAGDGHYYTGNQLELRTAEAIRFNEEIGFISHRKRSRYDPEKYRKSLETRRGARRPVIVFEDEIIEVEDTGRVENVWNLTIQGEHLFDANGILTHNCASEAFQMTGASFFAPENLTDQATKNASNKYTTWMYHAGLEFHEMKIFPAPNAKSVELKVWKEPAPDSIYVIAGDPAFGHSEHCDRSAVQVLRCYADGLDQVAEYASPLITTNHFAWVIASLCGWYGALNSDVYLIIELNGPGDAVWTEIKQLRYRLQTAPMSRDVELTGVRDIFRNVYNYFYWRSDSMSPTRSEQWRTFQRTKVWALERLRDFVSNGMLHVRSMATLEEMRAVTREGDSIGAQGRFKDDRVMAMALGVHMWEDRVRRAMITAGRDRESEVAKETRAPMARAAMFSSYQINQMVGDRQHGRALERAQNRRASWRYR